MTRSLTLSVFLMALFLFTAAAQAQQCAGDNNGDGETTIDEIVAAVNAALNGCPTPSGPTRTPTMRPPTPTPTPGGPRYRSNGDGTVTDLRNGLMWETKTGTAGNFVDCSTDACPDVHGVNNTYQWCADANHDGTCDNPSNPSTGANGNAFTNFLAALNGQGGEACFAGFCDWRLPTKEELEGLLLTGKYPCTNPVPCIDSTLGPTQPDNYWSDTIIAGGLNTWSIRFNDGFSEQTPKAAALPVRAVR